MYNSGRIECIDDKKASIRRKADPLYQYTIDSLNREYTGHPERVQSLVGLMQKYATSLTTGVDDLGEMCLTSAMTMAKLGPMDSYYVSVREHLLALWPISSFIRTCNRDLTCSEMEIDDTFHRLLEIDYICTLAYLEWLHNLIGLYHVN